MEIESKQQDSKSLPNTTESPDQQQEKTGFNKESIKSAAAAALAAAVLKAQV